MRFLWLVLLFSVAGASASGEGSGAPLLSYDDGAWEIAAADCVVVSNKGIDTIAVALDAGGMAVQYWGTWRGSVGRYHVARPESAARVELRPVSGRALAPSLVSVTDCDGAVADEAVAALSLALDLRLRGYFGEAVDPARIEAAFRESIARIQTVSSPAWKGDFFFEYGEWLRGAARLARASEALEQSQRYFEEAGSALGRADASRSLGLIAWRRGQFDLARQRFEQAVSADYAAVGLPAATRDYRRAAIFNNLGLVESEAGNPLDAIEYLETALQIFQGASDVRVSISRRDRERLSEAARGALDMPSALNTLNNLALLYRDAGNFDVAEQYLRNYLVFEAYVPEALALAQARYNLGVTLFNQGRLDEALRLLLEALDRFDAVGAGRWQAEALVVLSRMYLELGDRKGAWTYADRAARLDIEDRRARAEVLRQSGRIALDLERGDDAMRLLAQAGELLDVGGPIRLRGLLQSDLARAELLLGRVEAAWRRQSAAVGLLAESGFPDAAARARSLLGEILFRRGEPEAAIDALRQALQVQQRTGDLLGEFETLERLGRIQRDVAPAAAIQAHDRAMTLMADSRLQGLPALRRAGFRVRFRPVYERQIALLLDAGEIAAAWAVGEQARSGELAGLRVARARGNEETRRRQALDRHARLLSELHVLTAAASGPAEGHNDRVQRIRSELDRLEIGMHLPAGEMPAPVSLQQVQAGLGPSQRLLSFTLAQDRGWVWVIGNGAPRVAEIVDVAALRADVSELLRQLRHPRNAIGRTRQLLGDIRQRALAPVQDSLAGAGEILVQPDSDLHALPFALLWPDAGDSEPAPRVQRVLTALVADSNRPDALRGDSYRSDSYSNDSHSIDGRRFDPRTSNRSTAMLVLADPGWNESGHGDPMYPETSLLTRLLRGSALARLPGTRREAEAIAALGSDRVRVNLKLGRAATRSFVVDGGMRGYPLLHIATHGLVDLEYPELSALLLADADAGGPAFLRPGDIARLDLDAALVVLSGCDTGHGRVFAGSGAFSLARPFLIAGADQVLASLWKVDDHRTAQFMARFYHYLLGEHLGAAEALALTRHWMRQQPGNTHPYYWAGFVLTAAGISSQEPVRALSALQTTAN